MIRIKLPGGEWEYDPEQCLGGGGFGEVFAGAAEGYGLLAIKRIKFDARDAAHRELQIAEDLVGRDFAYVIPIFDFGHDAESDACYIVMPRAEKSLQNDLEAGRTFTDIETAEIMLQITEGLSEVCDEYAHRDLKPHNVLYHEGRWKVADFGIAKAIEEATSPRTVRDKYTPEYAGPELWRLEGPNSATDIYALGCVGYALLTGRPPFQGSGPELRQQHLEVSPPTLEVDSPRLRALLVSMLRKRPEARPNLDRVRDVLSEIASERQGQAMAVERPGFEALAEVGAITAEQTAREEAALYRERLRRERRRELAEQANSIFRDLLEGLIARIADIVPIANRRDRGYIDLGNAQLFVMGIRPVEFGDRPIDEDAFRRCGWDVIEGVTITVHQENPEYTRSASLWYTDLGSGEGTYRWWEVSYYQPAGLASANNVPFALRELPVADMANTGRDGQYRIASRPQAIDDENAEDFYDRWLGILAQAYNGKLECPRGLSLD
jgi:hypothetical protein